MFKIPLVQLFDSNENPHRREGVLYLETLVYSEPRVTNHIVQLHSVNDAAILQLIQRNMFTYISSPQFFWGGMFDHSWQQMDGVSMATVAMEERDGYQSWIPILDTMKQLNNKRDSYFMVGMTHQPNELRYTKFKHNSVKVLMFSLFIPKSLPSVTIDNHSHTLSICQS